MGGIGLTINSETRDGFIKAGFAYLQNFDQVADSAIEELEQDETSRRGVIQEIRELQERVTDVEQDEFLQLLADDWDERYPEVDDDEDEKQARH